MEKVAVIGAGPGGLVAARWLKHEGFEPVLFDQGRRVGGQWTGDARYSGVWPSLRTNSSRILTAFSDQPHDSRASVYPSNQQMCEYLARYAERFDLLPSARLKTTVLEIRRGPSGRAWSVRWANDEGELHEETYRRVVVATGRHSKPAIPAVPGVTTFSGAEGVKHTFEYKQPDRYRGLRVLVAGCGVSSLEVASDLAMIGAARVVVSNRRQRYIVPKLCAGVPADHLIYTRFRALCAQCMPPSAVAAHLKEIILRAAGNPAQVGAPAPADSILDAGVAPCQHFLPLVAEGRVETRPWIAAVDGRKVRFDDGSVDEFDAIFFGTGYDLHLPFLHQDIRRTLEFDGRWINLHKFTFHPDLPGLAFVLLRQIVGPNFPIVELQGRWIAYAWSGKLAAPTRDEMEAGVTACRAERGAPGDASMQVVCMTLANEAGVEPQLERWPELARALMFGPVTPVSFRLDGPDSLRDAPERTRAEAAAFGAVPAPEFTAAERAQLQMLAAARNDPAFRRFVEQVSTPLPA